MSFEHDLSFVPFSKALCHADGLNVLVTNERDKSCEALLGESPIAKCSGCLGGIATPPVFASKQPAKFRLLAAGLRALEIPSNEADATEDTAVRFSFDRAETKTPALPPVKPLDDSHLDFRKRPRHTRADVADDLRIGERVEQVRRIVDPRLA